MTVILKQHHPICPKIHTGIKHIGQSFVQQFADLCKLGPLQLKEGASLFFLLVPALERSSVGLDPGTMQARRVSVRELERGLTL